MQQPLKPGVSLAFKAPVTSLQAGAIEVASTSSPVYFCICYCFSVQQQSGITSVLTEILEKRAFRRKGDVAMPLETPSV